MSLAKPVGGAGGSSTFTGLTDTPASITALKRLKGNSAGTALEEYSDYEVDLQVDYGAVGDGSTDDTTALNNAIAAIPASGGTIVIPPTVNGYKISSTITITDTPIIFKSGGGFSYVNATGTMIGAYFTWAGGASAMFFVDGSGAAQGKAGVQFKNLGFKCNNTATYGIDCDQWTFGGCDNINILFPVTACMRLNTSGGGSNRNTQYNTFKDVFLIGTLGLHLDGSTTGGANNIAHNKFEGLRIVYTGTHGIQMHDADNNHFDLTWIEPFGSPTGVAVYFGARARANYFYQLQPGGGVEVDMTTLSSNNNTIVGYDRENGQPAPTITNGFLNWTEGGALSAGWNFQIYNYTEGTQPAATVFESGTMVYVSDADDKLQFSNGTTWESIAGGLVADVDGGLFTDEAAANSLTVDGGTFG